MKKILLIENHHKPTENPMGFLKLNKYQLFTAKDEKEGLNLARKIKPDLIIYNILREINGDKMFNNLMNDKQIQDIPIIFLSEKPKNGNL